MALSVKQQRKMQQQRLNQLAELAIPENLSQAIKDYLDNFDDFDGSRKTADALCEVLSELQLDGEAAVLAKAVLENRDQLARKTFWMFGGDGWAYDIGFGGLDHVVASGENINVLVVDTEVYSNTGGQSSKATPVGAVAQFASSGKSSPKKDLGSIFMTYGNVYVAQVAMGADPNQLIKALREAEAYPGPSVIVAYTPCLAHGLKCGMSGTQDEMKRAVEAGYWVLYRYNPLAEKPFTLDSREPKMDFAEFLAGENRYASLKRTFPDHAEKYFAQAQTGAACRYRRYRKMEENQ
jgi:pyruvate-ferredoxin/flavodoxin oxidoreductase